MVPIDDAHAALLRDERLQFDLKAPAPTAHEVHWNWSFGFDPTVVVAVLVAITVLVVVILAVRAIRGRRRPDAGPPPETAAAGPAVPLAGAQRALGDADALAAAGRFLEAAHVLLGCGVDAIARRFPGALRPTDTSRDIAAMASLPAPLRDAFGRIAAVVERGLFGGRPVDQTHYAECRALFVASAMAERA